MLINVFNVKKGFYLLKKSVLLVMFPNAKFILHLKNANCVKQNILLILNRNVKESKIQLLNVVTMQLKTLVSNVKMELYLVKIKALVTLKLKL